MMRVLFLLCLLCAALPARAETMKYIPDPVYQSFDPAEESPMQEMIDLAKGGDIRAQYILGDLFAKGKGGLARNERTGAKWFEEAARNGYHEALVRLAAVAKRRKRPIEAYKWYSLAITNLRPGPWRAHAEDARAELVKTAGLSADDLDIARKDANKWNNDAKRFREEQREQARRAAREAEKTAAAEKNNQDKSVKQQEKTP
jgi:TPR repeat protein